MTRTPFFCLAITLLLLCPTSHAGQFFIDLAGDGPNSSGSAPGWDVFDNLVQDVTTAPLTDQSGGGDNDVTLTPLDDGFNPNNPAPPNASATYDGIVVPAEARNDYLFKIADVAGTEARIRIDGLDPGFYNVTVFEGRQSDVNQVAKIWVGAEPATENTGNFAGSSATVKVLVPAGEPLWYKHLEDGSGGLSGMIINPTVPEPGSLTILAMAAVALLLRHNARLR